MSLTTFFAQHPVFTRDELLRHLAEEKGNTPNTNTVSFGLAKQLNMVVVAEGVEDQDDWDFLYETGCHLAQGYFIARPMLASDFPAWMEQWNRRSRRDLQVVAERKIPT